VDSEILLMDEPFSAFDPLIRRQLQDEFIQLVSAVDKTTVFITYDLDDAVRIGDQIAVRIFNTIDTAIGHTRFRVVFSA